MEVGPYSPASPMDPLFLWGSDLSVSFQLMSSDVFFEPTALQGPAVSRHAYMQCGCCRPLQGK